MKMQPTVNESTQFQLRNRQGVVLAEGNVAEITQFFTDLFWTFTGVGGRFYPQVIETKGNSKSPYCLIFIGAGQLGNLPPSDILKLANCHAPTPTEFYRK